MVLLCGSMYQEQNLSLYLSEDSRSCIDLRDMAGDFQQYIEGRVLESGIFKETPLCT